jgi:4-amino-4-deoxy-L-arabinose transferase-like glycosyltransferase
MGIDITSFYIYRFRYWIGYITVGLLLAGLLVFAGLYTPGGISDQEVTAVIKSSQITITDVSSLAITNLPYHLLQQASFELFGVSDFSIKLPSLILALLSAIGLILLLQRWFKPRIAVLASMIAISTGQFLFIAQSGTPGILYVLWSVWLLLLATLIAKRSRPSLLWKILFFVVAALSLYTPLSIYAMIAMGFATVLHPHLRYVIGQLSKVRLLWGALIGALIVTPLVIGIVRTPELALQLLGIPAQWPDIPANLSLLFHQYFGFMAATTTGLMTPVFGLGSMILIAIGTYQLIKTRDSTQSYLIIIWLLCLLPILIINPLYTSITFLPLVLLLATGLSSLLGYWYRLFPRNPYARIAGLVPLVVLVGVLMLSGLERYVYGYHYDPKTVPNFSRDLSLLPKDTTQLVVAPSQAAFYNVVQTYNGSPIVVQAPTATSFTTTLAAKQPFVGFHVDRIITSGPYTNADRFYVYKKNDQ